MGFPRSVRLPFPDSFARLTNLRRFERNFNHHSQLNLERISFHAGRENAAVLPLVVRLSYLKIGSRE